MLMPKYKDIKKRLIHNGFKHIRTKGSHEIWTHPYLINSIIVIPKHGSKDIRKGTESRILKQIKEVENELDNINKKG